MMFEIGDFVIKANSGICRVDNISTLDIAIQGDKERLYFFLSPINETTAKLYVPVDKEGNGIRKVITKEEAWELINTIPNIEELYISDDKQREQKYKEAIQSCDLEKIISIIKNMYFRKQKRTAIGKKNTSVDERFFKLAEDNLYTELAFALGRKKEEIKDLIIESIGEKK